MTYVALAYLYDRLLIFGAQDLLYFILHKLSIW